MREDVEKEIVPQDIEQEILKCVINMQQKAQGILLRIQKEKEFDGKQDTSKSRAVSAIRRGMSGHFAVTLII